MRELNRSKPNAPLPIISPLIGALGIFALGALGFYILGTHCKPRSGGASFPGGLDLCVKDSISATVSVMGLLAVAATAWGVINELRKQHNARADQAEVAAASNRIREEELRWRQATFAYKLLDEFFDDDAGKFLKRLDRGNASGAGAADKEFFDQFVEAFSGGRSAQGQEIVDIRLQFDRVLYYLDRMQHAIDAGILRLEDVKASLSWYAQLMAPYAERIEAYASAIEYERAAKLLEQIRKTKPV